MPQGPSKRSSATLLTGPPISPERRLKTYDPDELEQIVRHWLHETQATNYARLREVGGAGDKGQDVIGYESESSVDPWDNFQCKQYSRPRRPTDAWFDLCKLVFYVSRGHYTKPRAYYFVAARGVGPKLHDLLMDPEKVREGLIENWGAYGSELCSLSDIEDEIQGFAFPKLDSISGLQIISDLRSSRIFPYYFGGGLTKPRPPEKPLPGQIAAHELPYVGKLVEAYDDHSAASIADADAAISHAVYGPHLRESRQDFYTAESLKEFSRDVLIEPDDFASLQDEVFDGVKHTAALDHANGFDCVRLVCEHATQVQLSDHPLSPEVTPRDRSGICHQLANDDRLGWKKP